MAFGKVLMPACIHLTLTPIINMKRSLIIAAVFSCGISALNAQAVEERAQCANPVAIIGESTLATTTNNSIENDFKKDSKDAQDIELLRSTIEKFLADELIVFNQQRAAASVNDDDDYRHAIEKGIKKHARKIDKQLTEAFGIKSRLYSVCTALFRLAQSNDPREALKKARVIINSVNVEVLMRRELGFYLLLDESQFCDGQLIVVPCTIVEQEDIMTAEGKSAHLLFVSIFDTDRSVHEGFNRLAFRAMAIPGLDHYCINNEMVSDDAKETANILIRRSKIEISKNDGLLRMINALLPKSKGVNVVDRVWLELVLADIYDNGLLRMTPKELKEHSLRTIKLNAVLYAVGNRNQQPIIDFVVSDYDATGLNDIRKEIIARLIPLAYGEDIFTTEMYRLLTWANIIDQPRTDAIASRYILDRMAEKMNLDYSDPEFAEYKYEFIVYAILHKYKDRGSALVVKEIAKTMLAEDIDISWLLRKEATTYHPDEQKYVQFEQHVQPLMPFVDAIVKKYATIPHDETKHENTAYLSA
jgi:hypothetical protein